LTRTPVSGRAIRVCLDLNVWAAHATAQANGLEGGSSSMMVGFARQGYCPLGPFQLIASWRMLDMLRHVLVRLGHDSERAAGFVADVTAMTRAGPLAWSPHLVLGGTGVMPLRDAEDAAVLEVAVAAGADLLVTFNMVDFAPGPRARMSARVIARQGNRTAAVAKTLPDRPDLIIATPPRAVDWLSRAPRPHGVPADFAPAFSARDDRTPRAR
jgi:hypothetical protein